MFRNKQTIIIKSDEEIELIKQSSLLIGKTLAYLAPFIQPGTLGTDLDTKAEEFIKDHGGVPAFKGLYGCPSSLLISVNSAVVHGLPSNKPFKDGDVVSIDCGVLMNEFYGDSAYTFAVGNISEQAKKLLKVTYECLYLGIEKAIVGNRVGDISYAIQNHAEGNGYGVVKELVGHGLGRSLHEAPEVPNFGRRGTGSQLREGMTIAIEPMINMGKARVVTDDDGWTVRAADNLPSAHYEHTIVVTSKGPQILSSFEEIEKIVKVF